MGVTLGAACPRCVDEEPVYPAVRACVPSRPPVAANMIMTVLRANPAPGILAQIFINLSRSDVRRDGDLIRLRIIFLREKSCPFVATRPSLALL